MASTSGFDVAAGMHESIFNKVLSQVYRALYPDPLKDVKIDVQNSVISSVDIDIQSTPTAKLEPSEYAKARCAAALETSFQQAKFDAKDSPDVLAIASSATFTADFPKLVLTVNYANNIPSTKIPSASLTVHVTILVDGCDSNMTFKIVDGSIFVPSNPDLTDLLNKALLPLLIDYLNRNILDPIKIPPLGYKSVSLSTPLPVVQQSYFTAFSALGSTPATIPAPFPWPKDGMYIAADIAVIKAAARTVFPLGPREKFKWEVFSGRVGATVNTPTISSINANGSINVTIEANALCQLTMKTPWPLHNATFGPSATAGLAGTYRPIIKDGELKLVVEGIPIPYFTFDWGTPSWIKQLFGSYEKRLAEALNATLRPLVKNALQTAIPILKIQVIHIDFDEGKKINIAIEDAKPKGVDSLLVVSAQATVY